MFVHFAVSLSYHDADMLLVSIPSPTHGPQRDMNVRDLHLSDLSPRTFPPSSPFRGEDDAKSPQEKGKDAALRCWAEDEEFLAKEKIAEWLGGTSVVFLMSLAVRN